MLLLTTKNRYRSIIFIYKFLSARTDVGSLIFVQTKRHRLNRAIYVDIFLFTLIQAR